MGVPGEAVEQRRRQLSQRPIAATVLLIATLIFGYLYLPIPGPRVAAATEGDCVELHLYSNGYHSDIGAPAEIFPEDHPLRRLYPQARTFLVGWGDRAFYASDGSDLLIGLDALIPPSPSAFHITYDAAEASAYLGPTDDLAVGVSREGATRFVAYVDRYLVLDEDGDAIQISNGKVIGRSAFLRSRGSFHLLNVCNQWMARALRSAGIDVNARAAWLAGPLIRQARRQGAGGCASALSN